MKNIYLYILAMSVTTYLIRMIPLTVFRKKIKNRFISSFLSYIPCACLTAMTFPAILSATNSLISGVCALLVAVVLAFFKQSLVTVAASASLAVFLSELVINLL